MRAGTGRPLLGDQDWNCGRGVRGLCRRCRRGEAAVVWVFWSWKVSVWSHNVQKKCMESDEPPKKPIYKISLSEYHFCYISHVERRPFKLFSRTCHLKVVTQRPLWHSINLCCNACFPRPTKFNNCSKMQRQAPEVYITKGCDQPWVFWEFLVLCPFYSNLANLSAVSCNTSIHLWLKMDLAFRLISESPQHCTAYRDDIFSPHKN